MSRLKSLPPLNDEQERAADPGGHVWLSASAGSGKTQVLTARVLRLLLGGAAPESILCLTFTKAGAAEMANRLGDRLAQWVRMPDAALALDLKNLGEDCGPGAQDRARRLFAEVIEAPGGLRIQTIHGFAQTLLAAFPIEAGIVPGFSPIEGRAEKELARRTLADLVSRAEQAGNRQFLGDLETLSLRFGEKEATAYLMEAAAAGEAIAALGSPSGFEALLRDALGVPDGPIDRILLASCADDAFDCEALRLAIDANRGWGGVKGLEFADRGTPFLEASAEERVARVTEAMLTVLTTKYEPRKVSPGQIKADPDYESYHDALVAQFLEIRRLILADAQAREQAAGLRVGAAFAEAYAAAKRAAGVADFDDLIRWTRRLFAEAGMGEWVRFKLDTRVDHVLVDEAQDTNDDQWKIVDALVDEYFRGDSSGRDRHRTLFMVGDTKQAIYRFQGTDPRSYQAYGERKRGLADDLSAAALAADPPFAVPPFRKLSISESFRSAPAVLDVVDKLIGDVGAANMGLAEDSPPHRAFDKNARRPGRVELWPPFVVDGAEDEPDSEEGWIGEPARLYAEHVAGRIKAMLDEAPLMASTGRPLSPGDILILVRSRSEASALIVARLFALGVPVAGIDRLLLSRPLVVKDLLSAIRFAVQPHDSLNLAGLLVSPLLGWDQQLLYDLAFPRGEKQSLWDALRASAEPFVRETVSILGDLLAMADFVSPARYLETILSGPLRGRARLIARLGEEARDPIEELVSLALTFEREEVATLDRFLAWFEAGEVEIKRDSAAAGNAVRVMTVHGAKGLEAPLVILADATFNPADKGKQQTSFEAPLRGQPVPLLRPKKDDRITPWAEIIENNEELEREEHWRLLYVAVTRAAERLVIAGLAPGRGQLSPDSWHARATNALTALGAASEGDALVWTGRLLPEAAKAKRGKFPLPPVAVPEWASRRAPEEAVPPRPLSPSSLGEDRDALPPPSPAMQDAARRGTLLHALFERLPAVDAALRRERALGWLQRQGVGEASAHEIADAALAVIDHADFDDLFAPGALAEAPIAATLLDGRVIAGTVDRLCIGDTLVRVIDFKTGRSVPSTEADVPDSHRRQMAAYAEALQVIFPGRRIEASLLYTHGPKLVTLTG